MRRIFIGFAIFGFLVGVAFTGSPVGGEVAEGVIAAFEAWLWSQSSWIVSPSLLLLLIGFGVAWYGVRPVLWWRSRNAAMENWRSKRQLHGRTRTEFFQYFRKGYARWRAHHPLLPEHHNDFIDQLQYPAWLDGKAKNLSNIAVLNIDQNDNDWRFFREFYSEVDAAISGEMPPIGEEQYSFLDRFEHDRLHSARQTLMYFYTDTARDYYRRRLPRKEILESV